MNVLREFDDYFHKLKFITRTSSETATAKELGIKPRTFNQMRHDNKIPFEETLQYCQDRQIDILWLTNLQSK
ncbi:MAG: hypothetical protein PHV52_00150 [Aliarcobacter sp.]|nr:hypothetical protein [Aliarcobacter sp.]